MGRVAGLTSDSIGFRGAAAPAAMVGRLDRGAARVSPLRDVSRVLAPLTCAHLESLFAAMSDDALVAALGRYAQAAGDDTAPTGPRHAPLRRTTRAVRPARALPSAVGERARFDLIVRAPTPPPAATDAAASARSSTAPQVRAGTSGRMGGHPPSPRDVRGLEWLPLPDIAASAATSALDIAVSTPPTATAARSGSETARAGWAPALPGDVAIGEQRLAAPPAVVSREQGIVFPAGDVDGGPGTAAPVMPSADDADRVALHETTRGQLGSLVGTWKHGQPQAARTAPLPGPSEAALPTTPVEHDLPPVELPSRPATARPSAEIAAVGDALAIGDELGRVLVAELRRYGIEVDE